MDDSYNVAQNEKRTDFFLNEYLRKVFYCVLSVVWYCSIVRSLNPSMTNLQNWKRTGEGGKYFAFGSLTEVIQYLDNSLLKDTRDNKKDYFYLSYEIDPDLRDQLQTVIRECHNDEFPNDWRYSIIKEICFTCLDYEMSEGLDHLEQYLDNYSHEIVDGCVDISTSSLFQWLSDIPSRSEFNDDSYMGDSSNLSQLATARQYEEIDFIFHTLLNMLNERFT